MNCPYNVKICTKCKKILIVWEGNFYKCKGCKYGFRNDCKICRDKKSKQYYEENKNKIDEYKKQWYQENKEEILEQRKQYYEEHKKELKEYNKQYYEEHKEEFKEKRKEYNEQNPHISFNSNNKRRQLEENQGKGITKEQWLEMMEYFDWCCAYSGEYIGGDNKDKKRTIDHIVCLDNEGEHEIWNCVPMLKKYNSSKFTNNMEEWYIQQEFYSEERLIKIYAWCKYAYEKWS